MLKLEKAERLDSFFYKVSKDSLNQRARQHHSYSPFSQTVEPWWSSTDIVTMHPSAEAGLPHTRPPNVICMPVYYPEHLREETLKHELVHIDQRRRKDTWNTLFEKEGWTPIDEGEIPERWRQRCRMNPDTIDSRFWQFKDRFVPLPLYEREDKPDLRQVVVHWWDRETGSRIPQAPRLFLEQYGSHPQPEHPREIAAVQLAKVLQSPSDLDSYLAK